MKNFEKIINQEVMDFAKDNTGKYKLIADKIKSYLCSDYSDADDFYYFQSFIETLIKKNVDQALEEYQISRSKSLRDEIIEIADYVLDRRYDVMIALDDEEAFQKVLGYATDFLKGEDFLYFQQLYVNGKSLFALAQAYYNPKFKKDVVLFFKNAFEYAKNYAKENDKVKTSTSADPDGETLLELVQAISSLQEEDREQFANLVFEIYKFSSEEKRSYTMNQASGFMALQLTLYQTKFDITPIKTFISWSRKGYSSKAYFQQTLYTKWLLEKNTKEPFEYFLNNENNSIFPILALVDLNYKEALPLFIENQKKEQNPMVWQVYDEAIQRLQNNYMVLDPTERMIWLNGNLTPTQRALGTESDNIFVKRAKEKLAIDDNVYETDEE